MPSPGRAGAVYQPQPDLTDRREAVGREFPIDAEALAGSVRSPDVFTRLDQLLERHLSKSPPRLSSIDFTTREIRKRNGAVRIEALAAARGKSRRQFERDFLAAVGITPKQRAVIARFQRAAACVSAQPMQRLAAIAAEAGYADQSHMVRDFRRLGGSSPSAWAGDVAFVQDP